MPASASVDLSCHRHGAEPNPLTDKIVSISYLRGRTLDTSEGMSVNLKMTMMEATYLVRPGNWLVFRGPNGYAYSFGYVDTVSAAVRRDGNGALATDVVTVSAISWWALIARAHVYAPLGDTQSIGAFMSLSTWANISAKTMGMFTAGKIGESFAYVWKAIGRIKLPLSMGGEYLGDIIPLVHDGPTRDMWASTRIIESVARTGGQPQTWAPNQIDTSNGQLLQQVYQPDATLIELFTSLEPIPDEPPMPQEGGYSSPRPATDQSIDPSQSAEGDDWDPQQPWKVAMPSPARSKLAKFLGVQPVIIYRTPPWRVRPLWKSTVATQDFRAPTQGNLDNLLNKITNTNTTTELEAGVKRNIENHIILLKTLYNEVTWNYERAIRIYPEIIRKFAPSWSDAARVNITAIAYAVGADTGVEAAEFAGLPITCDESILEHGPRIARPTWTFLYPSQASKGIFGHDNPMAASVNQSGPDGPSMGDYLRSLAAQLMQYMQNAHAMATGTLDLNYTDAVNTLDQRVVTDIPAGEILAVNVSPNDPPFYCYVNTVTHSYVRNSTGSEAASTSISFSRGLFGFEEDVIRSPEIPMKDATPGQPLPPQPVGAKQQPVGPPVRTTPGTTPATGGGSAPTKARTMLIEGRDVPVNFEITKYLIDTSTVSRYYRDYRVGPIKNLFVHYNVGGMRSTASSLRNYFQKYYYGTLGSYPLGSHFTIDVNGAITQTLDVRQNANHVYGYVNERSVGVDLINPFKNGEATALRTAELKNGRPCLWPVIPEARIVGPGGGAGHAVKDFFGPTGAQVLSLIQLANALSSRVGVVLAHDPGTNVLRGIRRFSDEERLLKLSAGGIWHHAQFEANRADSLGTDLGIVAQAAKALPQL